MHSYRNAVKVLLATAWLPIFTGTFEYAFSQPKRCFAAKEQRQTFTILKKGALDDKTETVLRPTYIRMDLSQQTFRNTIDALSKTSGFKIKLQDGPGIAQQLYNFRFKKTAFWIALDQICQQAGAMPKSITGTGDIIVGYEKATKPSIFYAGPYRLVARELYESDARPDLIYFSLDLWAEPRITILDVGPIVLSKATVGRHVSLLTNEPVKGGYLIFYDDEHMYKWFSATALKKAPKSARRISKIKGVVKVRIVKHRKTIVINSIMKAKGRIFRIGQLNFEISDVVSMRNGKYQVRVGVSGVKQSRTFHLGRWDLSDDKEVKYKLAGQRYLPDLNEDGNVGITLNFAAPQGIAIGPPQKLTTWRSIGCDQNINFEFENLSLPSN